MSALIFAVGFASLLLNPGVDCDSAAESSFRDTAAGPIGEGIKSILGGVIDGAVSAVKTSSSSDSNSSTTN